MKTNKRLEALNALADIRDYMRELESNHELPEEIRDKFNLVATYMKADSDWCK